MKEIRRSGRFKKDYKRAKKQHKNIKLLESVVESLARGEVLHSSFHDHQLTGNLKEYRELHLTSDTKNKKYWRCPLYDQN